MALPKPNFARFFESYNVYVASHRSALHMFLLSCPFSDLKNSAKQTLLFARFCVFNNKNINHIWSAFQEHCQNENRVAQFLQKKHLREIRENTSLFNGYFHERDPLKPLLTISRYTERLAILYSAYFPEAAPPLISHSHPPFLPSSLSIKKN